MKKIALHYFLPFCLALMCCSEVVKGQGSISGKVLSFEDNTAISGASVAAYGEGKKLKSSAITDSAGVFTISNLPLGYYKITVRYIGMKSHSRDSVMLTSTKPDVTIKPVKLKPDTSMLGNVEIVANRDEQSLGADKKVYRVEDNAIAEGGTALDILRNLPSVNVAINGRVSLRGSRGVSVLIDGRRSGLAGSGRAVLDNLPANAIDHIEIITNPGAEYDAEGSSGIINIVLKKTGTTGVSGSIALTGASWEKYGATGFLSYFSRRVNFFSSYNYRLYSTYNSGNSEKQVGQDSALFYLQQTRNGKSAQQTHTGRLGVTANLTQNASLSFTGAGRYQQQTTANLFNQQRLSGVRDVDSSSVRNGGNMDKERSFDFDLAYEQKLKGEKHKFTAEVSYSGNYDHQSTQLNTLYYGPKLTPDSFPRLRNVFTDLRYTIFMARADYDLPIKKTMSLDAGAKSTLRTIDNNYYGEDYNNNIKDWATNNSLTNHFIYNDKIIAGYVSFGHQLKKFSYKAGLRVEYTLINTNLVTTGQTNKNSYVQPFPTLHLSYKATPKTELNLSYSRRINRPDVNQLNPFANISNPLTIISGNPLLKPELTNSVEFSCAARNAKHAIVTSLYYRYTTGVISRFNTLGDGGVSYITYENLASSHSGGVEVAARNEIFKWWKLVSSANLFYYQLNAGNLQAALNRKSLGGQIKVTSTFTFFKNFQIQLAGNYMVPQAGAQSRTRQYGYLDVALRKAFNDNRIIVAVSCSDVFNTNKQVATTNGNSFITNSYRKYETRIVQINVTFKFGNFKNNKQQDKMDESNEELLKEKNED